MNTENNPNRPRTRKCVYTVITGRYEHLASAPRFPESDWDYICLTDNPNLTSDTWTILQFEPPFENDHARNSRLPKACPHRFLQDYETSLYIDNTVALKVAPDKIEQALFSSSDIDWGLFRHSFRRTLLDEFNRVMKLSLDEPTRVLEQFITYKTLKPELLTTAPIWGGFILRRHLSKDVIAAGEVWYAHILRYSRRDQLSLPYVLSKHLASVNLLEWDNRESEVHVWNNKIASRDQTRRRTGWREMLPLGIRAYYQAMRLTGKIFKRRLKA